MKRFIIEDKVFEMFPHLEIGVLSFKNIDNIGTGKTQMLENVCKSLYERLASGDEAERYIKEYSLAMKKLAETSISIENTLEGSKHFEYLKTIGFYGDMNHCFTMDMFDIVPEYKNGVITK